jgi:hypothetical protein
MNRLLALSGLSAVIVGIALVSVPASLVIGGALALLLSALFSELKPKFCVKCETPIVKRGAGSPVSQQTRPPFTHAPVHLEPKATAAPPTSRSRALAADEGNE